jgi:hypothetical protein
MLDGSESPLVDVELEVLQDSSRLTTLPLGEVEQCLALARVRVFAIDPRQNLLWQDLVDTKWSTCPLPVETLCTFMVEMRIVHRCSSSQALPIVFRNRN